MPVLMAVRDVLVAGVELSQALKGISLHPAERLRQDFRQLIRLLVRHYRGGEGFSDVAEQEVRIAADIRVPFAPFLYYFRNGVATVSVPLLWKSKRLRGDNLSLYITLAAGHISSSESLSGAELEIILFPPREKLGTRRSVLVDVQRIPRLMDEKINIMLTQFIAGFRLAQRELREAKTLKPAVKNQAQNQSCGFLFDEFMD